MLNQTIRALFILLLVACTRQEGSEKVLLDSITESQVVEGVAPEIAFHYPKPFVGKWLNWSTVVQMVSEEKKREYLNKLVGNDYFKIFDIADWPKSELKNFHIIDFNADGRLDVIYAGRHPNRAEKDNFAFFENQEDSLRLTLKLQGAIIQLQKESQTSPISFVVWEWPCCADEQHFVRFFEFYAEKDKKYALNSAPVGALGSQGEFSQNFHANFQPSRSFTYLKSTLIPQKMELSPIGREIELVKEGQLVTNPYLPIQETELPELPTYYEQSGNLPDSSFVIASLPIRQQANLLAEAEVNGQVYYFICLSSPNIQSNWKLSGKAVENLLGWVQME